MENDAIAALPTVGEANRPLLRNFLIKRVIYVLDEDENPEDLEALDTDTGAIPLALGWNETLFWLDADDTTSAHDGLTTLVTNDGYRYKASELDLHIKSVLDRDLTSPPTTGVEYGDAFLVPAGSTGEWADFANHIALYTPRGDNGWMFRAPKIGDWLLIEDEDLYVRYKASGSWSAGTGGRTFDAQSIPLSALIGAAASFMLRVENQTTNAPPGTAALEVAYVIGSSPTGAWAGHAGKIAICEVVDTFTIYTPSIGDEVFDKALAIKVSWNGSAWVSSAGAIVGITTDFQVLVSSAVANGTAYGYSSTLTPTTSNTRTRDDNTIAYAAKAAGTRRLEILYNGNAVLAVGNLSGSLCFALFRDSEANAIAWGTLPGVVAALLTTSTSYVIHINIRFEIDVADASSHTYKMAFVTDQSTTAAGGSLTAIHRRFFTIKEKA